MRIEILVFDGFDELDALGPFEVLGGVPDFDVALVGVDGGGEIEAAHGLRLVVPTGLGRPDAVVVPGGGWMDRAASGSWAEAKKGVLPALLASLAPTLRWTASVCTGAMLLAEAGLLDGRTATTNRNAQDELRALGVNVLPNRVVDDGDIVTAGGITCGFDLALHLVEREVGEEVAAGRARSLEYRPHGDVHRAR